jgi:hypothetical protein
MDGQMIPVGLAECKDTAARQESPAAAEFGIVFAKQQ